MRELYPGALFACHEADRRWIESNAAMLAENYRWHELYGLTPLDEAEQRERLALLGGDAPIDLGLAGGETIRVGPARRWDVLHLPGHTLGHLGLWDADDRIAIIIDAALLDGIYDRAGNKLIPPRYYDAAAYRSTIHAIRALEPELLLTAHYPPMTAAAARRFCDRSLAYVDAVDTVVRDGVATGRDRPARADRSSRLAAWPVPGVRDRDRRGSPIAPGGAALSPHPGRGLAGRGRFVVLLGFRRLGRLGRSRAPARQATGPARLVGQQELDLRVDAAQVVLGPVAERLEQAWVKPQ